MAAEMVFAGYIQPLADYYSLFGVNHGEKNSQLEKFDDYKHEIDDYYASIMARHA